MSNVREKSGVPDAEDFRAAGGTPIVVNRVAADARAYFLDDAEAVREIGDKVTAATIGALTVTGTITAEGTINAEGLIDASAATAGQVKFPATENASTNANTLDDYEEGATTPTVTSSAGTITTVSCDLKYTKIGNRCLFNAKVTITTNGTGSGYIVVPLPFTSAEPTGCYGLHSSATSLASNTSGSDLRVWDYDGTYPGANGVVLYIAGNFRV